MTVLCANLRNDAMRDSPKRSNLSCAHHRDGYRLCVPTRAASRGRWLTRLADHPIGKQAMRVRLVIAGGLSGGIRIEAMVSLDASHVVHVVGDRDLRLWSVSVHLPGQGFSERLAVGRSSLTSGSKYGAIELAWMRGVGAHGEASGSHVDCHVVPRRADARHDAGHQARFAHRVVGSDQAMMVNELHGLHRRCTTFTALAAVLAMAVSVLGLVVWPHRVWILDGDLPVTSVPGRAAEWGMLVAGMALWLRRTPPVRIVAHGLLHYLALLLSVAVLLIGVLAIIEPRLTAVGEYAREAPMGANSALVFCLLGISLLTLNTTIGRASRPAEITAILAALIALTALFGYAYGVNELYTVHQSHPMVPRTAILGFMLAMAVLCARPSVGFMALATSAGFGGLLLRRLLPASLLMLFTLGWLRLESERRGWCSTELGVALFTQANIIIFTLLVWWSARAMQRLEQERDVSEQKRVQAMALNQLIMDNSLDVLCAVDKEGRFLKVSSAAQNQWGYAPAELIGRSYTDLVHAEDQERTAAVVARVMSGEPAAGFTNRFIRKDGSAVSIDWSAAWSRSDDLMFSVARDATERLQAAETLRQGAEELARSNRELESFAYSVSHDLRAPLRHIDGYARMLEEDGGDRLDGELRRYLDEIGASARRMGRLIDDLLAFSRLSRQPLTRVPIDMNALVDSALSEVSSGISVAATISVQSLPTVQADPALLKQVWTNLLANAIKYSGKRGVDARIEVTGQSDGASVRYQVRDNGVGFDMRYIGKLFQVFQRLHLQDDFEGTGVGLAIVQRIVSRHGGKVWAEGELGEGATFTFELPIVGEQPGRDMG